MFCLFYVIIMFYVMFYCYSYVLLSLLCFDVMILFWCYDFVNKFF